MSEIFLVRIFLVRIFFKVRIFFGEIFLKKKSHQIGSLVYKARSSLINE